MKVTVGAPPAPPPTITIECSLKEGMVLSALLSASSGESSTALHRALKEAVYDRVPNWEAGYKAACAGATRPPNTDEIVKASGLV